jgi:hypothetical protein
MEPSAVRDADGALLFCVRGACDDLPAVGLRRDPEREKSFLMWRSTDGGRTWSESINLRDKRGATPVTICLTAEGRPFIAGNDIIPGAHPMRMRQKLSLWPLTADRKGVEGPSFTFDCLTQFGPTPGGSLWHMDHPYNASVRLADGKPRSLLVMRVCEANEVGGGAPPTPRTGCWIAEVVTGR